MSARRTVHVTCHDCGMSAEIRLEAFGLRDRITDIASHSKAATRESMMLGNMRHLGVYRPLAPCLRCLPPPRADRRVDVPRRCRRAVVCKQGRVRKCGARGRHIDVRPDWKEQPPSESLTGKV
jgi:hypothetical protein